MSIVVLISMMPSIGVIAFAQSKSQSLNDSIQDIEPNNDFEHANRIEFSKAVYGTVDNKTWGLAPLTVYNLGVLITSEAVLTLYLQREIFLTFKSLVARRLTKKSRSFKSMRSSNSL